VQLLCDVTILIDENRASAIRKIFELFLQGTPIKQIGRLVRPLGYKATGNSSIQRVLENPTYGGLVKVPAYYDEVAKTVKGIHEGLVSEDIWWKTQALLNASKRRQVKVKYNEDVPLRGALKCHCGRTLTAGNSKGKKSYVWYYRCHAHNENLNAKKLHNKFDALLRELNFSAVHIKYLEEKVLEKIKNSLADQDRLINQKQNELRSVLQKRESIEEKFLNNYIDKTTYEKWHYRMSSEKAILEGDLRDLKKPLQESWNFYRENLSKLEDLHYIFHKAQIHQKHSFIHTVFNNSLSYGDGIYRTPYLLPIFNSKVLALKEKKLLEVEQLLAKNEDLMECSGIGS
jgi:site-specific DNA recombinase